MKVGRIFVGVRKVHTELLDIDECGLLILKSVEKLISHHLIAEIAGIFNDVDVRIDQGSLSQRNPVAERKGPTKRRYARSYIRPCEQTPRRSACSVPRANRLANRIAACQSEISSLK